MIIKFQLLEFAESLESWQIIIAIVRMIITMSDSIFSLFCPKHLNDFHFLDSVDIKCFNLHKLKKIKCVLGIRTSMLRDKRWDSYPLPLEEVSARMICIKGKERFSSSLSPN